MKIDLFFGFSGEFLINLICKIGTEVASVGDIMCI